MAASITWTTHISASTQDSNETPTAVSMFLGVQLSIKNNGNVAPPNGRKPEVRNPISASKLQTRISQLVYNIAITFKRLYPCFRGQATQVNYNRRDSQMCGLVEKRWRPLTRNRNNITYISACIHDSNAIPTAILMLWGQATWLDNSRDCPTLFHVYFQLWLPSLIFHLIFGRTDFSQVQQCYTTLKTWEEPLEFHWFRAHKLRNTLCHLYFR